MANKFRCNVILLSGNTVSANSNTLYVNGSEVQGAGTNINGLISTGDSDLRYLHSGVSGEFLKNSNLNGLISSGSHSLINSVTGVSISGGGRNYRSFKYKCW